MLLLEKIIRPRLSGLTSKNYYVVKNFHNNRSTSVRIQDQLSSRQSSLNGVPQREVQSVLLFLIAIKDISKCCTLLFLHQAFSPTITMCLFNPQTSIGQDFSNKIQTVSSHELPIEASASLWAKQVQSSFENLSTLFFQGS